MPVVAAAILQRIADFLAVGANPRASAEAGDGFSLHLARNAPANQPVEAGKTLPLDRQDLAGQPSDLPATDLDQPNASPATAEQTPALTTALPLTAAILAATDPQPTVPPSLAEAAVGSAETAMQQNATAPSVERLLASVSKTASAPIPRPSKHSTGPVSKKAEPASDATPSAVEDAAPPPVAIAAQVPTAAASAIATVSAEIAPTSPQPKAEARVGHADHRAETASAEQLVAAPMATIEATLAAAVPGTITTSEGNAPQMRTVTLPAAHETPAGVPAQAAVDQPAPALTQQATPTVSALAPAAAPAPTPTSITFVAQPITDKTAAPQPTEPAAQADKSDAAVVPTTAGATLAAAGEARPFRPTARQILASQPASDATRATEAETTVRAPAADAAPTLAQHLAPVSHGDERPLVSAAPAANTALSTDQAAALIETIQMLRSEAKSDAMTLAVDHDELGRITMRFDRTDHGVSVRIDSADPAVTQLIANSAPALKSSGDSVGMRFDRQDASGSGAGTSRDASRQGAGHDRNSTPYSQSSRPRASGQRDGLFA